MLDLDLSEGGQRVLATLLVALGLGCAPVAWVRWSRAERALRRREPLPSSGLGAFLALGVTVVAAFILVAL